MLFGCAFNFLATVGFAYLKNYNLLLLARATQAIGSSLSVVGGLAFLAATFPDEKERSAATAKAFSGISVGVAAGFALGGILYDTVGVEVPFLVLAVLNIVDFMLRFYLVSPADTFMDKDHGLRRAREAVADPQIISGLISLVHEYVAVSWARVCDATSTRYSDGVYPTRIHAHRRSPPPEAVWPTKWILHR